MKIVNGQTPMREIEIFGIPALFTPEPIAPDDVFPGMSHYELLSADAEEKFLGTVLTPIPVPMPEDGDRDVTGEDLIMDTQGKCLTPAEFEEKYLSPDYGEQNADRYGKDD